MTPPLYIHVRNWDRYQHPDTRRNERPVPWIKSYVAQLGEYDYVSLTMRQRGLLEGLRLLYAANRGSGLGGNVAQLGRMLGDTTVRARDIESLNQAGFIEFSASKNLATGKRLASQDVDVDLDGDKPLTADAVEPDSDEVEQGDEPGQDEHDQRSSSRPVLELVTSTEEGAEPDAGVAQMAERGMHKGPEVAGSSPVPGQVSQPREVSPSSAGATRPRDPLWDLLAERFGPVAERTNAHAKRNRAVADLRRLGATVETVTASLERWPRMFPDATVTDTALATHYPALAPRSSSTGPGARRPPCPSCGVGGGLHVAGCSIAELEERAA